MPPDAVHHIALTCDDPIAVERWYTEHFGFQRARVYLPGPDQVVMIKSGGIYLELFPATEKRPAPKVQQDGPQYSGVRHLAFRVDDVEAKLGQMGVEPTLGPMDMGQFIEGMWAAWVADPEGNIVELNQGYVDEDNPPALS
jgi:glyoxylase I family protein